jgi:DNA alkylation damage repair protein AlkB
MSRPIEIFPGAFHVPGFLAIADQRQVLHRCREIAAGPAGLYAPTVRGGGKMHLEMLCLGMHWNARTYTYESIRADADGLPPPPLPSDFVAVAKRAAAAVGMALEPQVCIVNFYGATGKLGVHQDKDERPETLAAGIPIVSISIGDTARFVVGGTRRKQSMTPILLESGDAFVMGGPSRLRYHGVTGIRAGTAPAELGLEGRFNLTFRQYEIAHPAAP